MLSVTGLAGARGGRTLFRNLSFALRGGERLRVTGENGSGKTTLLRTLCGLTAPGEGEVRWQGTPVAEDREAFWASLAYLGHANALKDELSAEENLFYASGLQGTPVSRAAARDALIAAGLAACARLPARALSQGQRRRVALARLRLCAARPLWVLDEPFSALDAGAVEGIATLLADHLSRGGMIVYTTHQDVPLGSAPERLLTLDAGRA